jgi:hypothetical protein
MCKYRSLTFVINVKKRNFNILGFSCFLPFEILLMKVLQLITFSGGGGPFPLQIFTQKIERFLQIASLFGYCNMLLII